MKHNKRKISLILTLFMVANMFIVPMQAYAAEYHSVSNDFIKMDVNSKTGWYTFGTKEGNPEYITDNNKKLLYGYGDGRFTTYTTMKINDNLFEYGMSSRGSELLEEPTVKNDKSITVWQAEGIKIKQIIEMVGLGNQVFEGTFKIRYEATNPKDYPQQLGSRIMMDTMLGNNDGAPIRTFDEAISETKIYSDDEVPAFWQAFDSLSDPTIMAQGTIWSLDTNRPNRFVVDDWEYLTDNMWDVEGSRRIDDSAVAIFWDQETIEAHETKYFETYYGVANLKSSDGDTDEKVSVAVASEDKINVTENGYSPNPFEVRAYISNNQTGQTVLGSKIEIKLPQGLKLIDGQVPVINLEPLVFGKIHTTLWQVIPEEIKEEKTYNYSIVYTNTEGEETLVQKEVVVPALTNDVPILQYVDVGVNADNSSCDIHIFGRNYSLLDDLSLFKIKLEKKSNHSIVELNTGNLTRRSDSELIISANNLEIGHYDLVIDHPIFDSKRFSDAVIITSKKLGVDSLNLVSTTDGKDVFSIVLSDQLSASGVTGEEILSLGNQGDYYSLDVMGLSNNSGVSNYKFDNSAVVNKIKLSDTAMGMRLTFASSKIDGASYVIDDKSIKVIVNGEKNTTPEEVEQVEELAEAVANQGETFAPETTQTPKKVSKLKVGVFELKGHFVESDSPIYEYVSSGTVSIGNNIMYTGGKVYVDLDRDKISCENGLLFAPTPANIPIPLASKSFDLVAQDGEALDLKSGVSLSSFEVDMVKFEFGGVEVFEDNIGAGLVIKDFSVSFDWNENFGAEIGEFKIYESGKLDASFEVSLAHEMDLDLKGAVAIKELAGKLGFNNFRLKSTKLGGKVEVYCVNTTFGAELGFDFDHWKAPYIDEFEISAEFEKAKQIPIGPILPSLDLNNETHFSYLAVLREIKLAGEKFTTGSYSDPANITGTTKLTDGVSPEIQEEYLLNVEGSLNISSQYAKISGDLGLYMINLADGEVGLYWVPRPKFTATGKVNIGGVFTGKTVIVAASNDVQFDMVGTLVTPDDWVWPLGGHELTEQEMTYDFKSGKFNGTTELFGHGIGVTIDVNPNTAWHKRVGFKFFGDKYQRIDALLKESIEDITPATVRYGTNIELIANYSSHDSKFYGSLDGNASSSATGPATVVEGETTVSLHNESSILEIDVNKQYEGLVLNITYDENISADFTLELPNGEKYGLIQIPEDMSTYANYSSKDGKAVIYVDPSQGNDYLAQGTYKLLADGVNTFDVNMSYIKPLLSIDRLKVSEKSSGKYDVEFAVTQEVQSTTSAAVTFYVSTEKGLYSGQKVKEVSVNGSAAQSFVLDLNTINGLTEEKYFLYAKLEKEARVPDRRFAESILTFTNDKLPQAPKVLSASPSNGCVEVSFERISNENVKNYFVGVLNESGGFDFTKPFVRVANKGDEAHITAVIEGLDLDQDYRVAVLSIAAYDEGDDAVEYIGKPSLSLPVYLHTPQIPNLTVEFTGIEGEVESTEDQDHESEYLSNTVLVKASITNHDEALVSMVVNGQEVTKSQETASIFTLVLKEGFNNIMCKAQNEKGDINVYNYGIIVDTIKPYLSVNNYSSFVMIDGTEFIVTGDAEVVSKLSINGSEVTIAEDGTYKETVALPSMSNRIEINLEDTAGNVSSLSIEAKLQLADTIQSVMIENAKTRVKANEFVGESVYLVDASNEKIKINPEDIQWRISDETILSVNDQGRLVGKSLGQATVSVGFALSQNNVIWSSSVTITVENSLEDNNPVTPIPTPSTPSSNSSKKSDRDDSKKITSSGSVISSTNSNLEKMVSPTDDRVVLDDVTINIPNHLIESNTLLTLTNENEGIGVDNRKRVSDYYNIRLGDLKYFDENFTIELPLDDSFSGENCAVYYYNESRGKWLFIGGQVDRENKTISFDVNHLTCFTVLETDDLFTFSDVDNRWSASYVRRLVGLGIVNGVDDSTFAPKREISRAEFMTMLYRALELEKSSIDLPFEDASSIPTYAQEAIKALYTSGLVKGSKGDNNQVYLNSGTEITRAEVCKLVYDYLSSTGYHYKDPIIFEDELPDWSAEAIKSLSSIRIVSGYEDGSFKASNHITREEAAKIIYVMLEKLHI